VKLGLFGHVLVSLAGAGLLGFAGGFTLHALRQLLFWPKTRATILRYWITRGIDGDRFYHPVLRFWTTEGNAVTTISSTGWWRRRLPAGAFVMVYYDPENPRHVGVSCFADLWGIPATCIGLALWMTLFFWLGWMRW
jgi:hypothetical protein